jgi:hypothetical protein
MLSFINHNSTTVKDFTYFLLQIEDVLLMIDIPAYYNVRVLNLEFNLIQSVESLMMFEPSSVPCLIPFRILKLAFNKITKVN